MDLHDAASQSGIVRRSCCLMVNILSYGIILISLICSLGFSLSARSTVRIQVFFFFLHICWSIFRVLNLVSFFVPQLVIESFHCQLCKTLCDKPNDFLMIMEVENQKKSFTSSGTESTAFGTIMPSLHPLCY